MPRPCARRHPTPQPADCRLCKLFTTDDRYNKAWGGPGLPSAARHAPRLALPCRHLGAPTGESLPCQACGGGKAQVAVRACAVHGECVAEAKLVKREGGRYLTHCRCPQYEAPLPKAPIAPLARPIVRNLLAHVWPRRGSKWRLRVEELLKRVDLFNGRRIVAVATDETTEGASAVRAMFGGLADEVFEVRNEPNLREVATFLPLYERVQSLNPAHVTFYWQSKGTSPHAPATGDRWENAVEAWIDVIHQTSLDFWPTVEALLERYPVVSALKKIGRGWGREQTRAEWFPNGSICWFRNRDLFSRPDWRRIDYFRDGIEPYLALHFAAEEAAAIFHEDAVDRKNNWPYDWPYWERLLPKFEEWKVAQRSLALTAARPEPLPAEGRSPSGLPEGWLDEAEAAELARLAKGRAVVEIGSHHGRSTVAMARAAQHVYAIDLGMALDARRWDHTPALLAGLKEHGVAGKVTVLAGDVVDMEKVLASGTAGLVFVDGDHSRGAVLRRSSARSRLLAPRVRSR